MKERLAARATALEHSELASTEAGRTEPADTARCVVCGVDRCTGLLAAIHAVNIDGGKVDGAENAK